MGIGETLSSGSTIYSWDCLWVGSWEIRHWSSDSYRFIRIPFQMQRDNVSPLLILFFQEQLWLLQKLRMTEEFNKHLKSKNRKPWDRSCFKSLLGNQGRFVFGERKAGKTTDLTGSLDEGRKWISRGWKRIHLIILVAWSLFCRALVVTVEDGGLRRHKQRNIEFNLGTIHGRMTDVTSIMSSKV